jgi:DNA repair photolyase
MPVRCAPRRRRIRVVDVLHTLARSILSPTSGFIAEAGFTHSLTPARNCTFACTYCYVPTMRVQGGLKPEDWKRWGEFTTFKANAPELLSGMVRKDQRIYCSPLVDPYQPAEAEERMMPRLLDQLIQHPPDVLVIQTRGPLILRDLDQLVNLTGSTRLRVSFSLTTNRDAIRRVYEPRCATIAERVETIRRLRENGIAVYATLAPLLPCDPEELITLAMELTDREIIGDPFHVRSVKKSGATTRAAGLRVSEKYGYTDWHEPSFQQQIVDRMTSIAAASGRRFGTGTEAFRWLAQ